MSAQGHDYSRHTLDELESEISNLNPERFPDRARMLQTEFHRRLVDASSKAGVANAIAAVAQGARYDQLDKTTSRKFFWPFFGFSCVLSFCFGFAVAFLAAIVGAFVVALRARSGGVVADPTQIIQVVASLILAVPFAIFWLKQITKRSFGGYGLRVVEGVRRDAV